MVSFKDANNFEKLGPTFVNLCKYKYASHKIKMNKSPTMSIKDICIS